MLNYLIQPDDKIITKENEALIVHAGEVFNQGFKVILIEDDSSIVSCMAVISEDVLLEDSELIFLNECEKINLNILYIENLEGNSDNVVVFINDVVSIFKKAYGYKLAKVIIKSSDENLKEELVKDGFNIQEDLWIKDI